MAEDTPSGPGADPGGTLALEEFEPNAPLATDMAVDADNKNASDLAPVFDVPVHISAVLGRASLSVAQLLKLRHSTVLDLSRRGVLPGFKIGKHWRYRRADLEEWLETKYLNMTGVAQ